MPKVSDEHIKDKRRRTKAETIMGEAGYAKQKRRARQARNNARKTGKSVHLANAREASKRVREYKIAQGDYRPPKHGKRKK